MKNNSWIFTPRDAEAKLITFTTKPISAKFDQKKRKVKFNDV